MTFNCRQQEKRGRIKAVRRRRWTRKHVWGHSARKMETPRLIRMVKKKKKEKHLVDSYRATKEQYIPTLALIDWNSRRADKE